MVNVIKFVMQGLVVEYVSLGTGSEVKVSVFSLIVIRRGPDVATLDVYCSHHGLDDVSHSMTEGALEVLSLSLSTKEISLPPPNLWSRDYSKGNDATYRGRL